MTLPDTEPRSSAADEGQPAARRVPGQPDIWAFALFELLVFTGYFAVYLVNRTQDPELYLRSQAELDFPLAAFNTLVMLTSSWSVARCVLAARRGEIRTALAYTWLTLGLGGVFLVSKVVGWLLLRHAGYGFTTDGFFTHYYFLTGLHVLHLLIGGVALGIVARQLRRPAGGSLEVIETGAVYWHTVDLLWVLIFSMLYVVR